MPLRLIIENTPEDQLAQMPAPATTEFIEAALHTAKHSKEPTRARILEDVCNVLNCRSEDLNFLFNHKTVPHQNRPILDLELPDYRMSLSDIYKEVAE